MSDAAERYAPGWSDDAVAMMSSRTAGRRARFLLPFLANGMDALDVGCGPGTITLGLTEAVAPDGSVVGVDVEPSQVDAARATAHDAGVTNVDFHVGSVYELPFAAERFDAVLAHGLVEHLARPDDALRELRRVLRAGGVVGVCSSDWSSAVVEPRTADVDVALACHFTLRRRAGGDPFAGVRLRALAEAAGFADVRVSVQDESDMSYGELARYVGSRIEAAARDAAASDRAELLRGVAAAARWARHKHGCFTQRWVAITARRPRI